MKRAEAEEQVHAALKDVYTTPYQPQPRSHGDVCVCGETAPETCTDSVYTVGLHTTANMERIQVMSLCSNSVATKAK